MKCVLFISLSSFCLLVAAWIFAMIAVLALPALTLHEQGYAKGVQDAKASPNIHPPVTVDEIDCEDRPDAKPGADIGDWCNGYKHGFVDTIMNSTK